MSGRSAWNRARRARLFSVAIFVALATSAAASAPVAAAAPADDAMTVSIVEFAFVPDPVVVNVGDTVTWSNDGVIAHTTTADDGSWDSGTMNAGDLFSVTFSTPGDFTYTCSIHPTLMTGTVSVQAPASPG